MYSRQNPSPRYRQLVAQYQQMHAEGEQFLGIPPEKTFPGYSLFNHVEIIKDLVNKHGAQTLLDYGSGKGVQYTSMRFQGVPVLDYWGAHSVRCYDPGYAPYSELPTEQFDGVICTDVLEHCPEDDLDWIMDEMFGFARKFVIATVAMFLAEKRLPNGENAHCTIKDKQWWWERLNGTASRYPHVRLQVVAEYSTGAA